MQNVVLRLAYVQNEDILSANSGLFLRYGEKRQFYSANQNFNYMSYVKKGSSEKLDYVAYSGNEEKSDGLFGKNGLMTKQEQSELKDKLRSTKSVIWHGVISFEKAFGQKYLSGNDDAIRLMKTEFPRFFKSAGLNPDNITWYAGLHENTKNRHIHFSFFENAPARFSERGSNKSLHYSKGTIYTGVLDSFKVRLEQRLTDITAELKFARKEVTGLMDAVLFSKEYSRRNNVELQDGLLELAGLLPKEGRLSYASENMKPLVPKVKAVIDTVIKSNEPLYNAFNNYCAKIRKRDTETKEMLVANKVPEKHWERYLTADKCLNDLYRRLGNPILNAVRVFRNKELKSKSRLVKKRLKKQTVVSLLAYSAKLSADIDKEAMDAFKEYLENLEENEREQEYGRYAEGRCKGGVEDEMG